jgi:hypothetical protein
VTANDFLLHGKLDIRFLQAPQRVFRENQDPEPARGILQCLGNRMPTVEDRVVERHLAPVMTEDAPSGQGGIGFLRFLVRFPGAFGHFGFPRWSGI